MIVIRSKQKEFGFIGKLIEFGEKYEKWKNPNYKTRKDIEEEKKQKRINEEKEILDKLFAISKYHKTLYDIEQESYKYYPNWGDGDEYPTFFIYMGGEYFGNVSLGCQDEPEYHWNGNYWEDVTIPSRPKRINNLKQELLKNLKAYRKEYAKIDYLDEEEIDSVLNYLDHLISIISRSSL